MKSEIVFHGVPQGHNVWGTDDTKYYEGFYNGLDAFSPTKKLFVVEVLRNGPSFSAYYSFIKANQVSALNGRQGSYFGMTLRTDDVYCTNVHSLYNLFDQVYAQKIFGHVVETAGDGLKYRLAKFSDQDYLLQEVRQVLEKNIAAYFSDSFEEFDDTFTKDQPTVFQYYNLDDTDSESFLNSTKVYGKILISPEFPSKDSRLVSCESRVDSLTGELESEKEAREQAEQAALTLRKKVDTLESQLEAARNSADVRSVAGKLEQPLDEMLQLLRSAQGPYLDQARQNEGLRKQLDGLHRKLSSLSTWFYAAVGAAAAFLILSGFLGFKFFQSKSQNPRGNVVAKAEYEKLEAEYNQLKDEQSRRNTAQLTGILQSYWASASGSRINVKPDPAKDENGRNVLLTPGRPYTLSLNGLPKELFDGKGEWVFHGLEPVGEDDPTVVEVSADSGEAYACYAIDGVVVIKRDFVVK